MTMPGTGATPSTLGTPASTPQTYAGAVSGSSATSSSSASANPVSHLFIEVVGVAAFALIANIGPRIGKVMVLIMSGILILWLVTHASVLAKLIPGNSANSGGG